MFVLTMSMPTPRPLTSSTLRARGQPGQEDQAEQLFARELARLARARSCPSRRPSRARACSSMPRPSSSTSIMTWLPFWKAFSAIVPAAGLPTSRGAAADLDAVIDGVANHVHQRIAELFDDQLVDLGLGAGDDQADLLAHLAADLAHDAREPVEHLAERHHAHLEDAVLQLAPGGARSFGASAAARRRAGAAPRRAGAR